MERGGEENGVCVYVCVCVVCIYVCVYLRTSVASEPSFLFRYRPWVR